MGDYVTLGGVRFDTVSLDGAVEKILRAAEKKTSCSVVTPNATILHSAFHDKSLLTLLQGASLILPDGAGVVLAARYLQTPFPHGRLAGVALGEAVLKGAAERGISVAFFGGKEGIAERARARMLESFPSLRVPYCRCGYEFSLDTVSKELAESGAEIVFVCLGFPLQEKVGAALAERLSCPVLCLGGSLDVYAGEKRRAPRVMQALGLEWLWRMLCEPSRFHGIFALFSFVFDVLRLKKEKKACNRAQR